MKMEKDVIGDKENELSLKLVDYMSANGVEIRVCGEANK